MGSSPDPECRGRTSWLAAAGLLCLALLALGLYEPWRRGRALARREVAAVATLRRLGAELRKGEAARGGTGLWLPDLRPGRTDARGDLRRRGYRYRLYLADRGGRGRAWPERAGFVPAASGRRYVLYAWPERFGRTGRRVFALLEEGLLLWAENAQGAYRGDRAPPPGACLSGLPGSLTAPPAGTPGSYPWGADGQRWWRLALRR